MLDDWANADKRARGSTCSARARWPATNLPWIAIWLKELITWGTLDPVAAFTLARGKVVTRKQAEETALEYYEEQSVVQSANDLLNPSSIRDWVDARSPRTPDILAVGPPARMRAAPLRNFSGHDSIRWRGVPVEGPEIVYWYDLAGFPLASSGKPTGWSPEYVSTHDFFFRADEAVVDSHSYLVGAPGANWSPA